MTDPEECRGTKPLGRSFPQGKVGVSPRLGSVQTNALWIAEHGEIRTSEVEWVCRVCSPTARKGTGYKVMVRSLAQGHT